MKKLLVLIIIGFSILGCSQQLNMQGGDIKSDEVATIKTTADESTDGEDFLEALKYSVSDDKLISFLKKSIEEDPDALIRLYPSPEGDLKGYIHHASALASSKVIRALFDLAKSEDQRKEIVNLKSAYRITPLHLAALRGDDEDIVAYLIEQGADVDAVDDADDPVLHYAIHTKANVPVVELLLAKGAKIADIIDSENGFTMLHWAVHYKNLTVVEYLLEYCATHPNCSHLIDAKTTGPVKQTPEELARDLKIKGMVRIFDKFNNKQKQWVV
jgi:hypothetical protein